LMEKALTLRGGQLYCQKYWKLLLEKIADGSVDIRPVFSHRLPLDDIAHGYDIFAHQQDDCTKVVLKTDYGLQLQKQRGREYPMGKLHNTNTSRTNNSNIH